METITIGRDSTVPRLGFGAMRICGPGIWGSPSNVENAIAVLRRALDLGIGFVDTADSYGPHVSEELIARALHPYPDSLVIATKGGLTRPGPDRWEADCRPERLHACVDGSLHRLRLDCIVLYQLHTVDRKVPWEEQVGALAEMQRAGKIRHVGLSNVDVEHLESARKIVDVASVQNRYNIGDRGSEPVLEYCERESIAFIPWFPLDAGDVDRNETLRAVAAAHRTTPYQVALAWLLERSPMMLPIPGTQSLAHLNENVAAANLKLEEHEFAALDRREHPAGRRS